jgi:hypothetical protein
VIEQKELSSSNSTLLYCPSISRLHVVLAQHIFTKFLDYLDSAGYYYFYYYKSQEFSHVGCWVYVVTPFQG